MNNKGSSILTTPIVIAIGIMFVATLIVFVINILMPYIWYEKLSSTCIKYMFIMEEYGYLSSKERQNLIEELELQGFDIGLLKIDATDKRQNYGDRIFIDLEYLYDLELPVVGKNDILMKINRVSVSKR